MKCGEFRQAYNRYLDGVLDEDDARQLMAHAEACRDCASYRDSLGELHLDLRRLPEIQVPADLMRKLEGISAAVMPLHARLPWTPELLRTLPYGLAGIVAALFTRELPPPLAATGDALLAFAGTFIFFLAIFGPVFLPSKPLPDSSPLPLTGDHR